MRIICLLLMLGLSANALAQEPGPMSYYAFVGAGGTTSRFGQTTSLFHVGGGMEAVARSGLGAGVEGGYLGPWSNGSNGIGILSVNALYRLGGSPRTAQTVPFITGGYSLGFRSTAASFGNFGGGLIHWFGEGTGLRLEFRDNVRDGSTHWLVFRAGLDFR